MGIRIGSVETRNRVFLAPMSGVTDEPFRETADALGRPRGDGDGRLASS